MLVVLLKFAEVGSRAVFVVLTTYTLGLAEAGQFGLVVTFQGLASFAFGYERHTDIQRRMVGKDPALFDQAVGRALMLFSVNYVLVIPFYIATLVFFVDMPWHLIVLCIVIAISEQLMNQAYLMSMVNRRYLPLLFVSVAKNFAIVAAVFGPVLFLGHTLTLTTLLTVWAVISGIAGLVIAGFWLWLRVPIKNATPMSLREVLRHQYSASSNHFLLGLTAILTLQVDRLAIGTILPLEQVGVYFRHILLVSMIYQVFNIAFYNRVLPRVFEMGPTASVPDMQRVVFREYLRVLVFVAGIGGIGLSIHFVTRGDLAEQLHLVPVFFAALLLVSSVRMRADFNGLIFNALHRESTIFRLQLTSFAITVPLLLGLTTLYGIAGTISAGLCGALLYFIFTTVALRRLPKEAFNAR